MLSQFLGDEKRINASEMKISTTRCHVEREEDQSMGSSVMMRQRGIIPKKVMDLVKERKLRNYGHVVKEDGLARTVTAGREKGTRKTNEEMGRRHKSTERVTNEEAGTKGRDRTGVLARGCTKGCDRLQI